MKKTCRPLSLPVAKSEAAGGLAVAPGAAGLLVVGLERARDALVADGAHVGLVDAHAERVGGDDDRRLAGHEAPLRLGARLAGQAGVVDDRLDAELARQPIGEPLALRARARVDDPGQRAGLGERGGDPAVDGRLVRAADDRERQVRAVEPRRDAHRVAQAEPGHDVGRHLRRRGRRRGDDRLRAEPARGVGEPEVVGPEVVPPLGHAVRLVDHEQADPGVADALEEPGRGEPLGRDVEQPQVTARGALERPAVGRRVLLGVDQADVAGRDPLDRLHLVLHQRDQRRDDDREVGPHERRQLVAERLARAGRHDHQHVATVHRRLDRLALARAGTPSNPKSSCSAPSGSRARATGSGGGGPSPGSATFSTASRHGRATIPAGPEGKGAFARVGAVVRALRRATSTPLVGAANRARRARVDLSNRGRQNRRAEPPTPPPYKRKFVAATRGPERVLERVLALRLGGAGERVLAREAGVAVGLARALDRLVDARQRQVGQRVGSRARRRPRPRSGRGRSSPRAWTCRSRRSRGGGSAAR